MNKMTVAAVGFVLGAVSGATAGWIVAKKRYEEIAQEEIDSVKEVFSKKLADTNTALKEKYMDKFKDVEKNEKDENKEDHDSYKNIASMYKTENGKKKDYSSYSNDKKEPEKESEPANEKEEVRGGKEAPYVISPDEFGEFDDYEKISLMFYSDQILADDCDEIVEDVDRTIGFESLNHFGEYEDDAVYVRNDRLRCDYEILLDERTYIDILKTKPHKREDL